METTGSAVTARTHMLHVEAEGNPWLVDVDGRSPESLKLDEMLDRLAE